MFTVSSSVSIVNSEHVTAGWEALARRVTDETLGVFFLGKQQVANFNFDINEVYHKQLPWSIPNI